MYNKNRYFYRIDGLTGLVGIMSRTGQ